MRRAYGKMKSKPHFLEELARQQKAHNQPEPELETTMQLDEEEKEAILDHPDVKRAMWILSDLILGKKRLVIKSSPTGNGCHDHTFTLEETGNVEDEVQGDAEQHSEGEA
jgi:hypothetical protein